MMGLLYAENSKQYSDMLSHFDTVTDGHCCCYQALSASIEHQLFLDHPLFFTNFGKLSAYKL